MDKISKSKTFQKGDDYGDLMDFVMEQIDTVEFQPEGTNWSGGEPTPFDPECRLEAKYIVTITRIQ